jgi:hypothetical protein
VSRVFEGVDREHCAEVQGEVVLRVTRSGRQQIKAFFLVDDRKIRTLTLQRFSADSGTPHEEAHFCLRGDEIQRLRDLALLIRTTQFEGQDKVRLEEGDLDSLRLTKGAARALLKTDPKMLAELVEREITERDIVAIAYRREQLALFERLLRDDAFFETEKAKRCCRRIYVSRDVSRPLFCWSQERWATARDGSRTDHRGDRACLHSPVSHLSITWHRLPQ